MHILNAAQVRERLPYAALVGALREMLQRMRDGVASAPQRSVVALPNGGTLLLMPATDDTLAITKFVTVHPQNRDQPPVQADVLVFDARTGERLMLLDGEVITGRRTAALSVLAAQMLASANHGPLLLIGAGAQARVHLAAFAEIQHVQQVYIYSRTASRAAELANDARLLGLQASVIPDPALVLDEVRLIVTATTSTEPVLPANVRSDAFIAAVGAFRPTMAELPAELVRRAYLVVDTLAGAQTEAGDLLQANVDWARVQPLADLLDSPPPTITQPIVFKSVGHALWDLAAVRVVLSQNDGGR